MSSDGRINILIVDDRPENLIALEAIIESEECNVVKAISGEEALKYLLKNDFAAILLDVQMPGMDGFRTAEIIKAREKTKNIPILFITANNMDSDHIFTGYSVGAIDYILKPFNPIILKAKVEGFIQLYKLKQRLVEQAEILSEKTKELEHMAYHDVLTELPNRSFFNEKLTSWIHKARQLNQPLTMMYLDMDRFKYINDSLGHIFGDRMLKEIADRLRASIRRRDIAARVGGDEFNILLPNTDRENALEIAENILENFRKPFFIDNYELIITTCIGISVFPFDGEDGQVLMRNADAALYRAKEQGKNRFKVFHSGMNIQSYKMFILQNDLRKAIENDELTLVYQPRIKVESGETKKAEALLRWNHPNWGTISPAEFIPLAEETGQIVEIGEWVLREVCKQNRAWQDAGYAPIHLSVNFSVQQFLQKDLVEKIQQILKETGISPELLEIEITESTLLKNEGTITKTLNQLREIGIGISIDDFGTGYSSLSYLMRFPIDTLKIDRSFIKDTSSDASTSRTLITAIISLAHNLNMSVVAEGVESEEQFNFLKKHNCQEAQGYLFSRPVSPVEFESFLTSTKPNAPIFNGVIYLDGKKGKTHSAIASSTIMNELEEIPGQKILAAALNHTKELYSISSREMDVFGLLVNGLSNKEISDVLYISEHTVKNHITRILQKLAVSDRLQAMAKVYQTCIDESGNLQDKTINPH